MLSEWVLLLLAHVCAHEDVLDNSAIKLEAEYEAEAEAVYAAFGRRQGQARVLMDEAGGVWAAYKKRLLAAPRVHGWQCNSPRLAGVLDFSRALPPTHRMPARPRSGVTGMGELPIVAEFEPNTCDLLRKHGCERVEGGAEDTPDGWLLDAIEVALAGCNAEGADECFAMDVGSNLGLISHRMLQAGARVVAAEPQGDLCCAAHHTAVFNKFDDRVVFLPSGVAVTTVPADATLEVWIGAYRYGEIERTDNFEALDFMQQHKIPTTVRL